MVSRRYLSGVSTVVLAAIIAGAGGVVPSVANAQDDRADGGFAIDEIVVTARRVEENLQDTPISVSAFTEEGLENRQIFSTDDLSRATPNLQFATQSPASGNNASSQIFIRGIGQTDFLPSTDPGVGLYLDGVYLARSVGATIDFFDVERVEVLKGPQGTLFGRNTIGGAINVVSKRPAEELEGEAFVRLGTDDRLDSFATVSIPLGGDVFSKVSVGTRDQNGYVTQLQDPQGRELGDENERYFRAQLRYAPDSPLEVNLTLDHIDQDENGPPLVFNRINPEAAFARIASANAGCPAPGTELEDPRCANNQFAAGPFANNGTFPTYSTFELWAGNLTVEYELSDTIDFKSITAYRDNEWTGSRDADNTPLNVLATAIADTQTQFSQELQLVGTSLDDRLRWLAGLYYFEEQAQNDYFVTTAVGDFSLDGDYVNETIAAFANVTFDLTERLHLTGGLRVFEETKAFTPLQETLTPYAVGRPVACSPLGAASDPTSPIFSPLCEQPLDVGPPVVVFAPGTPLLPEGEVDRDFSGVTPVYKVAYDFTDRVFGYASYSEGFKSGGFNGRQVFPLREVPEFDEENATAYEIGLKSQIGGTLRFNVAAFTTTYEDIQIVLRQDFAPININSGEATIRGFEAEAEWVPTPDILVQATVGYTDDEYDELSDLAIANGVELGNQLAFAPEWTTSLGASYAIDLGGAGTLTPRADWSYQSKVFFDAVNTEAMAQDSYSLVSASLRYDHPAQPLRVIASVQNLTDEVYRVAGFTSFDTVAAYEEVGFARGRQFIVTIGYEF